MRKGKSKKIAKDEEKGKGEKGWPAPHGAYYNTE